jgi:hypothetical protein
MSGRAQNAERNHHRYTSLLSLVTCFAGVYRWVGGVATVLRRAYTCSSALYGRGELLVFHSDLAKVLGGDAAAAITGAVKRDFAMGHGIHMSDEMDEMAIVV